MHAPKITLLAQEVGAHGAWATTHHLSISCQARPSAAKPSRSLCAALHYYTRHRPFKPCIVHGGLIVTRVVISVTLSGHSANLRMSPVCNPPPALADAVQAIYLAAFKSVTIPKRQISG